MVSISKATYHSKHLVVSISGTVDMFASPNLKKQLFADVENGVPSLALDLHGVEYMDSSGIGLMAALQKKVNSSGGSFHLLDIPKNMLNVLRISDLDKYFHIVSSLQELDGGEGEQAKKDS